MSQPTATAVQTRWLNSLNDSVSSFNLRRCNSEFDHLGNRQPANQSSPVVVPEEAVNWTTFSDRWASASHEDRRSMANFMEIWSAFNGSTREQIKNVFGKADQSGVDKYGEDVLRYELGAMPESDGVMQYHLTFVFENDAVIRVMENFIFE